MLLAVCAIAQAQTYWWNPSTILPGENGFNQSMNWRANQNGTGARIPGVDDDYFTADALDSDWTWRDNDNDAGTGSNSLTTNADQLTLTGRGSNFWGATNQYVAVYRSDIRGNFDITVKVVSVTGGGTTARAGIVIADDLTTLGSGGFAYLCFKKDQVVEFNRDEAVTQGELEASTATAALGVNTVWLRLVKQGDELSGYYKTADGNGYTAVATGRLPLSMSRDSQIGLFLTAMSTTSTATAVLDDFQAMGPISGSGYTFSFNGTGSTADDSCIVNGDVTAAAIDYTGYTGNMQFGSENGLWAKYYDNMEWNGAVVSRIDTTISFNWGAGAPYGSMGTDTYSGRWEGYIMAQTSETYTFYSDLTDDRVRLWINGTTVYNTTSCCAGVSGTFAMTAGVKYPIIMEFYENGGNAGIDLLWSSATITKEVVPRRALFTGRLNVTGNVTMVAGQTVTAGNGWLEFSGSGTQVFTPKSGATHPHILHSGSGTLQLATNDLTAVGFYQSGGTLDLNGRNLTTSVVAPNQGDFALWNGTSSSFTNLGGRTLTVGGYASFIGQAGNLVNMNPGSAWTLSVTGKTTADYANIGNNVGPSGATAYKSTNAGGNSGWTINGSTFYYHQNQEFSSTNFNRSYNYTSGSNGNGYRPMSAKSDKFESLTLGSAWTFYDNDGADKDAGYTLGGGKVRLHSYGWEVWGADNDFVAIRRSDITGNFDVSVKVVATNSAEDWKTGIMAADDIASLGSGGYVNIHWGDGNTVRFERDEATTIGELDASSSASSISLPVWLRLVKNGTAFTAYYKTSETGAWTQVGGSVTPQSTAANSQVGLFHCAYDYSSHSWVDFDDFHEGFGYWSESDNSFNFGGSGTGSDASTNVNDPATVKSLDFTGYSGTFSFSNDITSVDGGNVNMGSTMTVTAATGTLAFIGASGNNSTFTPRSGQTHPNITHSGTSTTTVATNALIAGAFNMTAGNWNWGSSTLTHTLSSITASSNPTMIFGTNTVQVTGNADFNACNVTANTGTLSFTGTSGTQVLTPKSGQTHPNILHSGASTLQLATNDLSALSFNQSAGVLDFNGRNLTTTSSGNFTLTNGTATTLTGLGGRTLTVAGNASFAGQSGNLLNLNPTSGWTINATGTLSANYALVANSTASGTTGTGTNSVDGGGNTNWNLNAADYSAWDYSARIMFNTTSTGANVSGNVNHFPLLVRLTADNFIFEQARSDGRDIRFRDPDGTPLYYQIERWDAAAEAAEIWVLVNQVDGNSDRDYVNMYWGNNSATSESNGAAVFSSAASFKGVWHLGEDGNTTANGYPDACQGANHGTGSGMTGSSDVSGAVGKGQEFDGSTTYISIPANTALGNLTSSFTLSAWFKTDNLAATTRIFSADRTTSNNGYGIGVGSSGASEGIVTTYAVKDYVSSGMGLVRGSWYHLAAVLDGGFDVNWYLNGAYIGQTTHTAGAGANTDDPWLIGQGRSGGSYIEKFDGTLDEVRAEGVIRNADWIKLSYETQKAGSTVLTYPNTNLSTWGYNTKLNVNTTASGANITSNLTNYPLLVRLTQANFNFAQANSDGSDLRFADSSGNLLSFEVERYDAANKLAEVWVLIPTVKGNNNSQWIRMYWGKGTAATLSSPSSVFRSSQGNVGVWHMNSVAAFTDAAGLASAGTNTSAADAAGMVGLASYFDADADKISVPAYPAAEATNLLIDPNAYAVFSFWVQAADDWNSAANRRLIFTKGRNTGGSDDQDWAIFMNNSTDKVTFETRHTASGWTAMATNNTAWDAGTWYQLTVINNIAGKSYQWYINGVADGASQTYTNSHAEQGDSPTIEFGEHLTDTWFQGYLDEVRIANVARSADWIKLDYETQKTGSSVVSVGHRAVDYAKSVQFGFNTTSDGANVSGNVANIPILVRLDASNFDFTAVRDDAADIQFVDKDGSFLYHEVAEWDKGNKSGKVWVKVPQVDGNSTADFMTLYYGCADCAGSPYAVDDSVWNAYTSVYHLNAPETKAVDAASLGNHSTYETSLPQVSGLTGKMAMQFDGSSKGYASVPNESNYDYTNSISVWAWIKVSSFTKSWQAIVTKGDDSWRLHRDNANNTVNWTGSGAGSGVTSSASVNDGQWHHLVGTYDGTNRKIYIDGVESGTVAATGNITNSAHPVLIGENNQATGRTFHGVISEVRLASSSGTLSADYIKLSYQNQKENSAFLSTPVTTSSFSASKVFKFNTTASGANVSGDVFDFPLLLRFTDATLIDATQSAGQDIRFLDADGVTWLDYQIERWDQSANLGEIWVKVPKVDGNSAGDFITMHYNDVSNGSVPDGQCATCVFGSNYKAVWRMNDNAASPTVTDLLGTKNGTFKATTTNENTNANSHSGAGTIYNALDFQGGAAGVGGGTQLNNFTHALELPKTTGSLSMWLKPDQVRTMIAYYEANGTSATFNGYGAAGDNLEIGLGIFSTGWDFTYQDGNDVGGGYLAINAGTPGTSWTHCMATWNRKGSMYLYVNGVQVGTASMAAGVWTSKTATVMQMGRVGDGTDARHWDGKIDEIHVIDVQRNADWAKLVYESQRSAPTLFNPSAADFTSSQKYSFNTTRTGANVMGDVENFPLLVRITGATIVDAVQNDWDDIRFLDGDGKTWLQYQVERWDKTNDVAEVWVLVPKVDGNSDRDFITLYYNDVTNGAVANGQCGTCVFSTSNGFAGVWHLNEDGNNTASGYADATTNAYHGTGTNRENTDDVAGLIGIGQDFDGVDEYIQMSANAGSTASQTVSFWMKPDVLALMIPVDKNPNDASGVGWTFKARSNGEVWYRSGSESANTTLQETATLYSAGNWIYVTGTFDGPGDYMRLYLNGALVEAGASTRQVENTATVLRFGDPSAAATGEELDGVLDEVQISSTVRDSNWIRLAYETQRSSGNLFWNNRPGPNNRTTLTATPGDGSIALSWTLPVTDSSNADSVGIWLKYGGAMDSVGAAGQPKVVILPKADSSYAYPATYPGTYTFGLAVKNAAGKWSPFTATSTDTVVQTGDNGMTDTIYVDSAIGTATGETAASCINARNPATPLLEIEDAVWCAQSSGFVPSDSLIIRILPGTYAGNYDNEFDPPSSYPVVIESFDPNSRAILSSPQQAAYTVRLLTDMTMRRLDVRAATNGANGIWLYDNADSVVVDGCRIFNNGSTKHAIGIDIGATSNEGNLIANNLIHEPTSYGVYVDSDDRTNILNNTFVGSGAAGTKGIYMNRSAWGSGYMSWTNNIFYNWDYGIHTTDSDNEVGVVSNNLFHLVSSGQDVVGETDPAKVVQDPKFYSTNISDRNAFKLLPGSPAIEGGTSTISTGASEAFQRISNLDHFRSARPYGSARDIGFYEGSGYTPTPTGDFDSLTNTISGNTVIVKNSKWKLVWDMARGGGITGFYDMTGDTTANLVGTGSLLFDVRIDGNIASSAPSNAIVPVFMERTRARSVVRQRVAFSASLDLNVYYTVWASGHVYVHSEIANLGGSTLDVDLLQYNLKLGAATAVTKSASNLAGISFKNGFGYLTAATKDAFLSATQDLDAGAFGAAETWSQTGSVAGSLDSVGFSVSDLTDLLRNMKRSHFLLLYVGDGALDMGKASTINADASNPSPVSVSSGSLLHERSWQDRLGGHWTFDEGAGTAVKDRSINYTNNGTATSGTWISGKVGSALRFTAASVVDVPDADPLEAAQNRTYMLWVKPDFSAMGADAFLLSKGLTTSDGWHFRRVNGVNRFKFVMGTVELQTPTLTTGNWTHLAAIVDGSRMIFLYVNGILAGASTTAATLTVNASALRMGENAGGGAADRFAGDIDDVRIYHLGPGIGVLQAIVNQGFSIRGGYYNLRADNNNRVVALLNETTAQTRVQPAFQIDNWYGTRNPKYVYLNGTRLLPHTDFTVDSIWNAANTWDFGNSLVLQLNKVLTGTSQTLFVDDDDSSGYMGEAGKMKSLTMTATANDKFAIQNFAGSIFGTAASGQWYLELDLNGWTSPTAIRDTDTGFGEINVWKAAAISPNLAVTAATQLSGLDDESGRTISHMKFDGVGSNEMFSSGLGYASPANISYTLVDSSATRLSLTLANMTITGEGTITLKKRFTIYPTGRIFSNFEITTTNFALDEPRVDFQSRYSTGLTTPWTAATATATGRWGRMGGDLDYHSLAGALLSIKSAGATTTNPATMISSNNTSDWSNSDRDYSRFRFYLATSLFEATDDPVTVNYVMDISKDFADSATADSLMKDLQTPAAITALTGTAVTNDALDFNADAFAEGDGAYTYTAAGSGVAQFKFVNTVAHFSPAFRIKSWTFTTLPEYVIVDNQTLTRDYHYNAYVNNATSELILQLNRTLLPGNHIFYIAHKTGLAVTLNRFEAKGGVGEDTLTWATESEFENLGFHLWRRASPVQDLPDSLFAGGQKLAGSGIANALLENARATAAAKAAADSGLDTLPILSLSPEQLKALGYVRLTAKLIPGAKGGSSATTQEYLYVDRTASFGVTYDYLLEAVDFSGARVQYGPRSARPKNPLETALLPNYPNPFNPVTTLRFSLRDKAKVSLTIYDAKGRLVRVLIRPDRPMLPGQYRLLWDARDDKGFEVPSGQYFYRFTAPKYVKTRKMILVK